MTYLERENNIFLTYIPLQIFGHLQSEETKLQYAQNMDMPSKEAYQYL